MDPIHSLQSKIELPKREERFEYRLPDPTSRKDIEYYRDPVHRGYLAHTVPEGDGPSLFFKTPGAPGTVERVKREGSKAKKEAGLNKLW